MGFYFAARLFVGWCLPVPAVLTFLELHGITECDAVLEFDGVPLGWRLHMCLPRPHCEEPVYYFSVQLPLDNPTATTQSAHTDAVLAVLSDFKLMERGHAFARANFFEDDVPPMRMFASPDAQ